jgi:hypothetical protein
MSIHPDASVDECMEEISALEAEIERLRAWQLKTVTEVYEQFGILLDQSGNGMHLRHTAAEPKP